MTESYQISENAGFSQLLENSAERFPDKTAIVYGSRRLLYRELNARACAVANLLQQMGIGLGKRVAVLMPNCPEFLEIVFGCAKAGVTAVKINWRLAPEEIINLLRFNEVKAAFLEIPDTDWEDQVIREIAGEIPCVLMRSAGVGGYESLTRRNKGSFPPKTIPPDTGLMHIHTSGTTGTPKCVVYTHGSLLGEVAHCIAPLDFDHNLVFQVMVQLFHSASIGSYMCLAVGGTLVLFRNFDPEAYLKSIQEEQVTRISAIPTVLQALLSHPSFGRYDLSSLKALNYSTCPMAPTLIDRALKVLSCDFYQSYGMTEMGSIVSILDKNDHRNSRNSRIYSVGRPIPGYEAKIMGSDGTECTLGVIGEIALKGPGMMKGYFKMPEESAKCIRDGWYYSNDMGYMDREGYLYLQGRRNDMIITGGENVFPKEIEDIILQLIDDVEEASVFSVPDDYWGEKIQACVVLYPHSRLQEEDVRRYLAEKTAKYKIPKNVYFVRVLPKNASGKVLRKELSKQYSAGYGSAERSVR